MEAPANTHRVILRDIPEGNVVFDSSAPVYDVIECDAETAWGMVFGDYGQVFQCTVESIATDTVWSPIATATA